MQITIVRYIRNPDNYFFDIFDAASSALLGNRGHDVQVVERVLAPGFDEQDLLDGLVEYVGQLRPDLIWLSYVPFPELVRRLKERTNAPVVAVGSRLLLETCPLDLVLPEPDPLALVEIAASLESDGFLVASGASGRVWDGRLHSVAEIFLGAEPDYSRFVRLGPGRPVELRKHIAGEWGCPAKGTSGMGFGSVVPMERRSPDSQVGCTFCTRPPWSGTPWDVKELVLGRQLDAVLAEFPKMSKLIVIDDHILGHIDKLMRLWISRPTGGIDLLVSGRLDQLISNRHIIESALELLGDRAQMRLYQFGIENLSDSALQRLGKGMTYETVVRAVRLIDSMLERHPNLAVEPSFGFIMFDPWTTIDELKENCIRAPLLRLHRFRPGAVMTSLRLTPETPLWLKAKHDGLLLNEPPESGFGYSAHNRWRFLDPNVQAIHNRLVKDNPKDPWNALNALLGRN